MQHLSSETVRDYLLETLAGAEMASFEERYFTHPELLQEVKREEERLMEDYLRRRLRKSQNSRFEKIYLSDPNRAEKVEALRRLRAVPPHPRERTNWKFPVAILATAACLAALGIFAFRRSTSPVEVAKLEAIAPPPETAIRLRPGLMKSGAGMIALPEAAAGSNRLRVSFEMPGLTGPIDCKAKIFQIEPDGGRAAVASSPLAKSRPGANTEVAFTFDRLALRRGDYVAELTGVDGAILETYSFRSPNPP